MSREFEIRREITVRATAQQVFDAVATAEGAASWLFPIDAPEPRVGGKAAFGGTVTAYDPPSRFTTRSDFPDGGFNELDDEIVDAGDGTCVLRYTHRGVSADESDLAIEGINEHTDLYVHTLVQYLEQFTGQHATYVGVSAPDTTSTPGSFGVLVDRGLGLTPDVTAGDGVHIDIPGVGVIDGTVDYRTPNLVGIRTTDALYRFFGRDAYGAPVYVGHHLFAASVDAAAGEAAWSAWLADLYAPVAARS